MATQQRLPDEVVICDDDSLDGTVVLAEAFARQVPFPVRVVRNSHNLGYQRNFAQAVSLCSGDVIALCDQDDVWYPQKLSRFEALFSSQASVAGIFSNGDLIDPFSARLPGDLWGSFAFTPREQARFRSGQAVEVLLQRNVVTGMAFAFRSEFRNRLEAMPESWPHDAWLALMLANEGKLIACPELLVAYRVHETQTIGVPIGWKGKWMHIKMHGVRSYSYASKRRNVNEYRQNEQQFRDLLDLPERDAPNLTRELRTQAGHKLRHAKTAADRLTVSRLRRWPSVLRDMALYRRYASTGLKAMIRDLVL